MKRLFGPGIKPKTLPNLPGHIAIIMDGNGRWAQKRGLPRIAGHRVGLESIRSAIKTCACLGIKYLTVYAFSTENWSRPKEEVSFLMNLVLESLDREIEELSAKGVRIRFLGRISEMDAKIRENGLCLQIMLNYGGRAEITDAINRLISEKQPLQKVSEADIGSHLYTDGVPDPDLLIRTGGDLRVSNFMLWQIAYSEIYVTKTLWPDFREKEMQKALEDYSSRSRRFGGL